MSQIIKGSKEKEKFLMQRDRDDVASIMSTHEGRRFMWRILSYCGIYHDFDSVEATTLMKQAGRRQVGLHLLGLISDACQDDLFTMMVEAKNREENENIKESSDEPSTSASSNTISNFFGGDPSYGYDEFGDI